MDQPNVKIFAGRASRYLAEKIAKEYGSELGKSDVLIFADGEFQPSYEENIRGCDIFIVQSTFPPADNLFELLMMVDAAKRASARKIIAIMPYFGCGRQDRKDKPRIPISAKLVANLLMASGVNRVVTIDLHADQIQGFFEIPVDHLYASSLFSEYIRKQGIEDLVFASPDAGGTRRANMYAKIFERGFAICYKQRSKPNVIDRMDLIGDVKDKNVILVDDILDTGGTMIKAAELILSNGAKSVRAMVTHPILSGTAIEKIKNSCIEELVVADTIPLREPCDKITVLSTAKLLSEVIKRIENYESISDLYNLQK